MTPLKSMPTIPADQALRDDIQALIKRHLDPDTPERVMAIAAMIVGQVIALQDQRMMTRAMVMDLVVANIEVGNQAVIALLQNTKGTA